MATYKNYSELQAVQRTALRSSATPRSGSSTAPSTGNTLQYDDHIIFEHNGFVIEYIVHRYNLYEINDNYYIQNKIFQLLGLDPFDFCKQHYSKLSESWDYWKTDYPNHWPPYCDHDYESATKAVLELFFKIEKFEELAETSEILFID